MSDAEAARVVGTLAISSHFAWAPEKLKLWCAAISDLEYTDAKPAVERYIREVEPIEFSIRGFRFLCDEFRSVREARVPKLEEPKAPPEERARVYAEFDRILAGLKQKLTMPAR